MWSWQWLSGPFLREDLLVYFFFGASNESTGPADKEGRSPGRKVKEGGRTQKGSLGKLGSHHGDEGVMIKSVTMVGKRSMAWREPRSGEEGLDHHRATWR